MVPRRRYTPRERTRVAYEQGYKCASCTLLLPPDWQLDHVLPLCAGGGNERANVQALCVACHTDKTARATRARPAVRAVRAARRTGLLARLWRFVSGRWCKRAAKKPARRGP